MVAIAPSIVQVYEHIYWDKILRKYELNDADYDLMLPNKEIGAICQEAGIPVSIWPRPLKAARKNREKRTLTILSTCTGIKRENK